MDLRFYCDGLDAGPRPDVVHGGVGVYLHGLAEDESGFDIPDTNVSLDTVADGVHPVQLNDQPGYTLFLWRAPETDFPRLRGLVVKDVDAEGMEFARKRFETKPIFL